MSRSLKDNLDRRVWEKLGGKLILINFDFSVDFCVQKQVRDNIEDQLWKDLTINLRRRIWRKAFFGESHI